MVDIVVVISVITETSGKLQPLCHKTEILLQRHVVLQVVVPLLLVTGLSGHYPRVGAQVVTPHVDHRHIAVAIHHRCEDGIVAEQRVPCVSVAHTGRVTHRQVA